MVAKDTFDIAGQEVDLEYGASEFPIIFKGELIGIGVKYGHLYSCKSLLSDDTPAKFRSDVPKSFRSRREMGKAVLRAHIHDQMLREAAQ